MFNPTPSGQDGRSLRARLNGAQSVEPAPSRILFSLKPQPNGSAGTEKTASPLEDKNGDGFVVIGKGAHIVGEISNCSKIEISGYLEGGVMAREVIVREGGCLKGHVQSERAEVHGAIEGEVHVQEHLDIRSTGQASGELVYGKLSVAPGGKLAGKIQSHSQLENQDAASQPAGPRTYVNGHPQHPAH
jgi:cytoskeletal protein CcmA (bactofilin family)